MRIQKTQFNSIQKVILNSLTAFLQGDWSKRSLSILSLLLGYYLVGSNLAAIYLSQVGQRTYVVFCLLLIIEFSIRVRTLLQRTRFSSIRIFIDNLRIGAVYAVVLEAFKLGS